MRARSIVVSLTVSLFLAGCGEGAKTQASPPPPPPSVEVTQTVVKELRQWDDVTGHLEAIDSASVHPRVGGFIDSVRFHDGAHVRQGDVLFQIDPRPFQAQVDQLAAEVERAKAQAVLAGADNDRGQRLIKENAVARGEFERLQSVSAAAKAGLGSAEAALRAAQLNLDFTRVVAPIDGRVSRALITRGNLVTPNDVLTTVVSDGPVYATFNIDEQTYLKYVGLSRDRQVPVQLGLMNEEGFSHRGTLQFIDNAVDEKSGTITGRAVFDDPDHQLTPGLFARIRLMSSAADTVALTPERALGTDLGKRYLLVVNGQNAVEYRPVTLGAAVGELRIITTGLKAGDNVIVSGLQKVKPGDTVTPISTPFPQLASVLQP